MGMHALCSQPDRLGRLGPCSGMQHHRGMQHNIVLLPSSFL